ncbi:MAG: ribulose-phosphate 3-epimerase [Silvanigrellales bacterium]|nr:ribulose-phosphate 3-epimerase [Silvanigrellales bacterium]
MPASPQAPGAVRIQPSIAAGNLLRLEDEVRALEKGGADGIHFDCMDGHFVPLLTIGVPFLEQMRACTRLHLDVHIMVTNPDAVFEQYLAAGADTLTFHPEVALHAHRLCTAIRARGKRAGLALNPGTSWRFVESLLPFVDQITIMAVNPGFSRQAHIPEMAEKVRELASHAKAKNLVFDIQVDGGVNEGNAALLAQHGATVLVAGGAVLGKPDYGAAIRALRAERS